MPEVFADVSAWQGAIAWNQYKAGGYKRVGIKATEGNAFVDPRFAQNAVGSAGLQRIFYDYGRPDLGNSPESEADFLFQTTATYRQPGDALELDFEQQGWAGNYEAWKDAWLAHMATLWPRYGMYSGRWFMGPRGVTWGPGFSHLAAYGTQETGVDIQQYTDQGSFPGISGGVDANWLLNPAIFDGAPAPSGGGDMTAQETLDFLNGLAVQVAGQTSFVGWMQSTLGTEQNVYNLAADADAVVKAVQAELDQVKQQIATSPSAPGSAALLGLVQKIEGAVAQAGKDLANA